MPTGELVPTRRPVPADFAGGRLLGTYFLDLEVVGAEFAAAHVRSVTVSSSDLASLQFAPGQDLMIEFLDGAA